MVTRREYVATVGTVSGAMTAGCLTGADDETDGGSESAFTLGNGPLTFVLLPSIDEETQRGYYRPFADHLETELDTTVDLQYAESYTTAISRLGEGEAQLCDGGTLMAALGVQTGELEIALQRKSFGTWTYGSVLVTKEESDVSSVADIAGREVAFGDRLSASGMLMPLFMLNEAGLDIGNLPEGDGSDAEFDASFTSHEDAWEKLTSDEVPVAGVGDFITYEDGDLVDGYEYVEEYLSLPNPPFVISPVLSDAQRSDIVDTLRDAPAEVYHGADGDSGTEDDVWFDDLRPANESEYQIVIDAAAAIDLRQELLETSQ